MFMVSCPNNSSELVMCFGLFQTFNVVVFGEIVSSGFVSVLLSHKEYSLVSFVRL